MNKFMDDCIHLRACRRCNLIAKQKGVPFARNCNEDCTAYQNIEDFRKENMLFTYHNVQHAIIEAGKDVRYGGCDPEDNIVEDYLEVRHG